MSKATSMIRNALAATATLGLGALLALTPGAAHAQQQTSIALRDTFPIGSNGLCEAQIQAPEAGAGLFDRRYSIICRDAARPVGTLWVVKAKEGEKDVQHFAGKDLACTEGSPSAAEVQGLGAMRRFACSRQGSTIRNDLLIGARGGRIYAASGLTAYAKALELGLASLAADKAIAGTVEIPLTSATDDLTFARQQAEAIDSDQALVEAYRRSNAGNFAEAAEFFAVSSAALVGKDAAEAQLNAGLQQSNLGNFAEARRLFAASRSESVTSPILARLLRNYEAMDALNRRKPAEAMAILERPVTAGNDDAEDLRALRLGGTLASELASENERISGAFSTKLTPAERMSLLDGQRAYLMAAALRLQRRPQEAEAMLGRSEELLREVRGGRVISIAWLRAQILGELAEVAERSSRLADAERLHKEAITLIEAVYPGSPALGSTRAQLAGLYARSGRRDEALAIYREIVSDAEGRSLPSLRMVMTPYFALLTDSAEADKAAAAADLFAASQLLQRPGLAQTQAALARELSGGSDEAAQLFRTATNLGRGIEQLRVSIIEMESQPAASGPLATQLAERRARLAQLQEQQAEVLGQLAAYPRYRAVSGTAITLAELQSILGEGEAYVKLVTLERDAYVVYITHDAARAWRADATAKQLETLVTQIRESIAVVDGGEVLTYPFDIVRARELYVRLFSPVAEELPKVKHLVFEPDGALLKLPINLLVADDASVAAYQARMKKKDADEYDFRGTKWLGRTTQVSTSVAASAFRDVRAARPSNGKRPYIGLGENQPIGTTTPVDMRARASLEAGGKCSWSPNVWGNPIKANELREAATRFGNGAEVVTGPDFTDSEIGAKRDLADFRIIHFATHGLVTAPQPECPPRPALLTSFDVKDGSDGLLSFSEIFGLRIDADLVILSACDTAGSATVGATREAGVTSGGEFALDGLVRAFVGAGGRTVLASHWPVPDDFGATGRLISGLLSQDGRAVAEALQTSQVALMDDAETSHPFYWSAFAIVGDGRARLAR